MNKKTALWIMNRIFDTCVDLKKDNQTVVDQLNECRKYIKENLK